MLPQYLAIAQTTAASFDRNQGSKLVVDERANGTRYEVWRGLPAQLLRQPGAFDFVFDVTHVGRLDVASNSAYNTPYLHWVIAFYGSIKDPWAIKPGDRVRLPALNEVLGYLASQQENRGNS